MSAEQGGRAGMGTGPDDGAVRSRLESSDGVVTLSGIHNFRDVAGPGYSLEQSGSMARGVVYRSAAVSASDGDVGVLERLGVSTIVDLRSTGEVSMQPDVPVPGAKNVNIDVLQGNSTAATLMNSGIVTVDEARTEMARTYEQFVLGADERAAFGRAVGEVATSSGASVVHCTAGKDRTGWISAVLQLLAGVAEDDVVADYLLTREHNRELTDAILQYVQVKMPHQAEAIAVLLEVDESNIRRSLDALNSQYGDVRRYLIDGTGLEGDLVDELGARLRSR
ncbi:tyrosine-protein phosphatase [Dietzia alimentaria]|uniref:tyrosine-protein phosphatase n=1 Tax=Dietzia alimentaria TaxID=665550 RepID=UPI0002F563C3|nr:tyrosine-protein phosphatase [Dietzia alimentaria]